MTRAFLVAMIALSVLVVGSVQHAAIAGGALIETSVPLADRSEESVKAALVTAIDRAVRGASAMGFAWFQLRDTRVFAGHVAVQIVATDDRPDRAPETDPGDSPDAEEIGEHPGGLPVPGPRASM